MVRPPSCMYQKPTKPARLSDGAVVIGTGVVVGDGCGAVGGTVVVTGAVVVVEVEVVFKR